MTLRSFSSTWMSTSSASGRTATVTVDVWMRPADSVTGTRCTRWTPPLELQPAPGPFAVDGEDDLLEAALPRRVAVDHLDPPALGARRTSCTSGPARRRTGRPRRPRHRRGSRRRRSSRRRDPWGGAGPAGAARGSSRGRGGRAIRLRRARAAPDRRPRRGSGWPARSSRGSACTRGTPRRSLPSRPEPWRASRTRSAHPPAGQPSRRAAGPALRTDSRSPAACRTRSGPRRGHRT